MINSIRRQNLGVIYHDLDSGLDLDLCLELDLAILSHQEIEGALGEDPLKMPPFVLVDGLA